VKHIVYTSFLDADAASPAEFAQVHATTEAELRTSGLGLTILRNTLYSDFLPMTFGGALQTGVLHLPTDDGRASYLSRDELAEATAAAALAPQPAQEVYELTGPESVDSATLAAIVSRVTGKPIRYEPVAEADYAKALEGFGLPGWLAVAMGNMYTAVAQGRFAKVTGDFARLTGHAPKSVETHVAALFGADGGHGAACGCPVSPARSRDGPPGRCLGASHRAYLTLAVRIARTAWSKRASLRGRPSKRSKFDPMACDSRSSRWPGFGCVFVSSAR
jgi:hypothetical protein